MTLAQTIAVALAVVACCTAGMFAVLGVAWKLAQRSARREIAARHARPPRPSTSPSPTPVSETPRKVTT